MPTWLTGTEHRTLRSALDRLLPGDGLTPAAGEAGGADYVDVLLGAFAFDPPRIWAGGPFSGRRARQGGPAAGDDGDFDGWLVLGAAEELAWRMRIEGSQGRPEREFNGPVVGLQDRYRNGLARLGADFADVSGATQDERLDRFDDGDPTFRDLLFTHACEALYGDPVYGGNRDRAGWAAIEFAGDVLPRGWTAVQVADPVSERSERTISTGPSERSEDVGHGTPPQAGAP